MNILPKKSWHVRTKKNIERVRRDEANAAEEEKELKRRIQLAEQEARTQLLRKKAKGECVKNLDPPSDARNEHVTFFKEIEDSGTFMGGCNKEHEEEEKARKEKFEKDIGLLTYLGQSSIEAKGAVPWYLNGSAKEEIITSEGKDETTSSKHKSKIDPLNEMKKFLALKEKKSGDKEIFIYKKVKDKAVSKDIKKKDSSKNMSKIEELRAKRLKREAEEKKRSQKFLESFRKGSSEPDAEVVLDDRSRQYNSQFNPHLARNNLVPTRDHSFI